MGYTFKKMSYPRVSVQKGATETAVLRKLRSFLDKNEPGLVYLLMNLHQAQGKAITYKELREAILAGEISAELLDEWMQDYSRFVDEHLRPAWIMAMEAAVEDLRKKYPEWYFDPMADGARSWAENRGAEFVTNSTRTQIQGLRAVVQRAAVLEDMNVDMLARAVRSMVGLTWQQGIANMKYYENLVKNGVKEKKALDLSIRYAARQHRYRGYNIARTELAFAYNQGSYEGTKQAQAAGYMGEVVKIWCLEGKIIAIDDDFDFKTKLATPQNPTIRRVPPAHPSCRCTVMYEEIAPPIIR